MPSSIKTEQPLKSKAHLVIALAGNPNSGKTTIFNALTGLRQKVANYPGVTVEKKTGRCTLPTGQSADVVDLPGTYSLISRSPDEKVAMEVLRGLRTDTPAPDAVIVVVDASNLQRNLYLVSQLIEMGCPLIVALNMVDIAERRGIHVSAADLSARLGVPVIPVVGSRREGIETLKANIVNATVAPMPDWPLPDAMKHEIAGVRDVLDELKPGKISPEATTSPQAHGKPAVGVTRDAKVGAQLSTSSIAERLLIGDHSSDIDGFKNEGIIALVDKASGRLQNLGIDPMQADIEAHYRWIEDVAQQAMGKGREGGGAEVGDRESDVESAKSSGVGTQSNVDGGGLIDGDAPQRAGLPPSPVFNAQSILHDRQSPAHHPPSTLDYAARPYLTQRVDAILVHRVWGLLIFAAIMGVLFFTIFWIADPIMGATEEGVGWLGEKIGQLLPAEGALHDLWADGIVAGVGGVVVFVPQIAILFLFLAILEDSGYLARAAFLMDKLLSKVGLHGKSFIPLLSSFACAIPGIMAARTIESRKDRLATIFVAPFMSCSARLPVYALLIGAFFGSYGAFTQAGIMFAMYFIGILAAVVTAFIFKRTMLKGPATSFILEMPSYKWPQIGQVARTVWVNTRAFLLKAGTTIFALSVIIWAMTYFPQLRAEQVLAIDAEARTAIQSDAAEYQRAVDAYVEANGGLGGQIEIPADQVDAYAARAIAAAQLRYSIAGRFGHLLEPVIKPLGYDWKMGVGLFSAFAAREVFVSTMGIVYSAGDTEEDMTPLADAMKSDRYASGKPVWTPLVAVSLLVWFVLAMQCMSTIAIVRRETGGWGWPLAQLVYMNGLAYVVCLIIFQTGKVLGWGV